MIDDVDERSADLLARWRQGDQQAADQLFRRYADRLIVLVRSRLSAKLSRRIDPEDVVQSAYRSFFRDARAGRYESERGGDLWRLLLTITLHKLQHHVRGWLRQKRDVELERNFGTEDSLLGIQPHLLAGAPSPIEAVALAEQVEQIMRGLEPAERRMFELRLQGYNIDEIADQTACGERTVRRFLKRIKTHLEQQRAGNSYW